MRDWSWGVILLLTVTFRLNYHKWYQWFLQHSEQEEISQAFVLSIHLTTVLGRIKVDADNLLEYCLSASALWCRWEDLLHQLLYTLLSYCMHLYPPLTTTHCARNLGFIFDKHLTFSDQISSVSKSCYYHIRQLRCNRPYHDTKTASTVATSIVHSKLDYCNSLSQPAQVSDHPAATDPELSCMCCCQSSQIQSHHSHPLVSTLAKDKWAHWIQAPLTHLQSSDNHPTFISA